MPVTPVTQNIHFRSLANAAARTQGEQHDVFTSLFRLRPGKATETLRSLHFRNDAARVTLVQELCQYLNSGPTAMQMQAFLSTGLLGLLLDIVSEKESYILDRALHVSSSAYTLEVLLAHHYMRHYRI